LHILSIAHAVDDGLNIAQKGTPDTNGWAAKQAIGAAYEYSKPIVLKPLVNPLKVCLIMTSCFVQ